MIFNMDIWMTMVCGSIVWGAVWSVWRLIKLKGRGE